MTKKYLNSVQYYYMINIFKFDGYTDSGHILTYFLYDDETITQTDRNINIYNPYNRFISMPIDLYNYMKKTADSKTLDPEFKKFLNYMIQEAREAADRRNYIYKQISKYSI